MSPAVVTGKGSSPGIKEIELSIRGMTSAACAARVEKKIAALGDVAATVNLATEKGKVALPSAVPVERLIEAVGQAGYEAELTGPAGASGNGGADAAWPFHSAALRNARHGSTSMDTLVRRFGTPDRRRLRPEAPRRSRAPM